MKRTSFSKMPMVPVLLGCLVVTGSAQSTDGVPGRKASYAAVPILGPLIGAGLDGWFVRLANLWR